MQPPIFKSQAVTRREFLRQIAALAASSMFLAGCAPGAAPILNKIEQLSPLMPNSSESIPQKVHIVLSDTHMGAGFLAEGNVLEDFSADSEWETLIRALTAESQKTGIDMDLIINGDWFDYLQVPALPEFDPQKIYPSELYVIRSEAAALQQTDLIYNGHRPVFDSVRDFLNAGTPRRTLTILFGNHDPELIFPGVQEQIRGYLDAAGEKAGLVHFADRTYFEDGVYVEHGNAYLDAFNRFADPEFPVDPLNPALIEHPIGSLVVSYLYNDIERERFWIDAVLPLASVLIYGFAFDIPFTVQALRGLREADPKFIDDVITSMRADGIDESLVSTLERVLNSEQNRADLVRDINNIPNLWRTVAKVLVERDVISESLGEQVANSDMSPAECARLIREEAKHDLEAAADLLAQQNGAQVLCFGHIHEFIQERLPQSDAIYLNTGTWINTVDFSDASIGLWYDLVHNPQKYTNQRNLAYARIEHDAQGKLLSAGLYSV